MPLKNLRIRRLAALKGKYGCVTAAFQQDKTAVCVCLCVRVWGGDHAVQPPRGDPWSLG